MLPLVCRAFRRLLAGPSACLWASIAFTADLSAPGQAQRASAFLAWLARHGALSKSVEVDLWSGVMNGPVAFPPGLPLGEHLEDALQGEGTRRGPAGVWLVLNPTRFRTAFSGEQPTCRRVADVPAVAEVPVVACSACLGRPLAPYPLERCLAAELRLRLCLAARREAASPSVQHPLPWSQPRPPPTCRVPAGLRVSAVALGRAAACGGGVDRWGAFPHLSGSQASRAPGPGSPTPPPACSLPLPLPLPRPVPAPPPAPTQQAVQPFSLVHRNPRCLPLSDCSAHDMVVHADLAALTTLDHLEISTSSGALPAAFGCTDRLWLGGLVGWQPMWCSAGSKGCLQR